MTIGLLMRQCNGIDNFGKKEEFPDREVLLKPNARVEKEELTEGRECAGTR